MDPGTAILVAGAASSVINGVSTGLTNAKNMKLAKYAYAKELEMWNRQNEYNLPKNQMMRLAQAGLNPNLVYGNGSVVGNTTSDYPKFHAPNLQRYQNSEIMETAQAYQNLQMQKAQINLLNKQANKTQTETDKLEAGRSYWQDNERLNNDMKNLSYETMGYTNEEAKQNARTIGQLNDLRVEQLKRQNNLTDEQAKYLKQMAYLKAKEVVIKATDVNNRFKLGLGQLDVARYNARTNRMNANTLAFNAQTNRMNAVTNRMQVWVNGQYLNMAKEKQEFVVAGLAQNFLNSVTQGDILTIKKNTDSNIFNRYGKYGYTPNVYNSLWGTAANETHRLGEDLHDYFTDVFDPGY